MATTINASASAGFIATPDTSGVLQLQTGGTTAVTVDASQNVGIGTASPDLYAGRSTMSINGSTGGIITLQANGTQKLRLFTGASSSIGALTGALDISTGDASALTFGTNSAERMRVNAGAPILCLSGGNTSATGTGIAFPATQSASSDVNTLDDYEEGTWTPATSTSGLAVSAISSAFYTKVGRQVTCYSYLTLNNTSGSSKTAYSITGLPFVCASGYGFAREFYNGANGSASAAGDQYVDNSATVANFNGTTIPTGTSLRMVYFSYFAST